MAPADHGYTLEEHIADSGRLAERAALRLLAALAAEAETIWRKGGLLEGIVAADVVMDGEPELARIRESIPAKDPRRSAAAAPETAAGDGATERAVVFALGLVAFHALSGTPAYRAASESARRAAPVFDLRAHRVSETTIELIRRATARDPGSRPARIKKLRRAAEKILRKTRWDGDRPARRERRTAVALPAIALATTAATIALFYFRIGPFEFERVTGGFSRLFSRGDGGAAAVAPETPAAGTAAEAPVAAAEAPPPGAEPANAGAGSGEDASAPTPADESDYLFPRQPSAADNALYKEAMEKLAAARSRIETSAFDSGDQKFGALREAMALLAESRGLLDRYAETHPEKRATVERKIVEINQELVFCRKILPTKE